MLRSLLLSNLLLLCVCPVLSIPEARNQAVNKAKEGHPLDPLNPDEIDAAVALVEKKHGAPWNVLFPMVALDEPSKEELNSYKSGKAIPRRAFIVLLDRWKSTTFEAIVDLTARKVTRFKELPGIKAITTPAEVDEAIAIIKKSPKWLRAMKARGVKDIADVFIAAWASGPAKEKNDSKRLFRILAYDQGTRTNTYDKPIEGVVATVDLNTGRVTELLETVRAPIPKKSSDFFRSREREPYRKGPMPLQHRQPLGRSFTVRGYQVQWQKWQFRYAMHPREGLVLHTIGYEDSVNGRTKVRPILHRVSLSEMVVPYADPEPTWNWRAPFDQGEYGIGWYANSLQKGVDVPDNAVLYDTHFTSQFGKPYLKDAAVAIYERDGGLLFKHMEDSTREVLARRARELVIRWVTTIGNYEYGFNWVFRQDGSLRAEVDLTGVILAKAVAAQQCALCKEVDKQSTLKEKKTITPQGDQRYGTLVDSEIVAINHQHMFNFRLDFDLDGMKNSFSEMNLRSHSDPKNPWGNAFVQEETLFAKEKEAQRSVSVSDHRTWKIFNPNRRNRLGHHTGYVLIPGTNGIPLLSRDAPVRKRGGFMNHHVHVTRYHSREMHAAGDYPRQNPKPGGLPEWSGDESIVNEDLVVWYTLIATHVPRPEEWPVMPTTTVDFRLAPWGFFDQNPALDVPVQR